MLCAVIISFPHVQDGITPLYVACEGGHKQIVIVLLESGANVNLTTVSSFYNLLLIQLALSSGCK